MTSERAINRNREARGTTLERLRAHTDLTDLLGDVVATPAEIIMPAFELKRYRNDSNAPDPPDVAVTVSVVTGSSDRINALEQVNVTIQVELEFRTGVDPSIGTLPWADAIGDEISAVMTSQIADWHSEGETGGTPEPLWDDSINRYRAVKRFDIWRID